MGRCRSYEYTEYKSSISNMICKNDRIIRFLTPDDKPVPEDPTTELLYKYIIPYGLVPGTQTEVGRYLNFDVNSISNNTGNKIVKLMTITFDIICHNTLIKYPDPDVKGRFQCWFDLVLCELDEMFCGNKDLGFGVGKFEIIKVEPYFVSYAREIPFSGKTVTFRTRDFVNGNMYGK